MADKKNNNNMISIVKCAMQLVFTHTKRSLPLVLLASIQSCICPRYMATAAPDTAPDTSCSMHAAEVANIINAKAVCNDKIADNWPSLICAIINILFHYALCCAFIALSALFIKRERERGKRNNLWWHFCCSWKSCRASRLMLSTADRTNPAELSRL